MKLRDYQETMVKDILATSSNVIAALPTGGGKSVVIAEVAIRYKLMGKKIAVVVRMSTLIAQLITMLEEFGLSVGVVKAGYKFDDSKEYDVVLIMEQTFSKRSDKFSFPIDIVLKDEFHNGYTGVDFNKILTELKPERIIGLTATPITSTGIGLTSVLSDFSLIEGVSMKKLIDKGYLSSISYDVPKHSRLVDLTKVEKNNIGEYTVRSLDMILLSDVHTTMVVDSTVEALAEGKRGILFANSIKHIEALVKAFTAKDIPCAYMHSDRTEEENKLALETYLSDSVHLMINMSMLSVGFDDPSTDLAILVRPTKIQRLYIQLVGRALRIEKKLTTSLNGLDLSKRVALVTKVRYESKILEQLASLGLTSVDVLVEGTSTDSYDEVVTGVRPDKKQATILDLAQCLQEHGFVEDEPNYYLTSKDEVKADRADRSLDELPDLADTTVTKTKVLEYRLLHKTARIDELMKKLVLEAVKTKNLQTEIALRDEFIKEMEAYTDKLESSTTVSKYSGDGEELRSILYVYSRRFPSKGIGAEAINEIVEMFEACSHVSLKAAITMADRIVEDTSINRWGGVVTLKALLGRIKWVEKENN